MKTLHILPLLSVLAIGLAACSAAPSTTFSNMPSSDAGPDGSTPLPDALPPPGDVTRLAVDIPLPEPSQVAEVYGHSDTTLYRLDPTTKEVTTVGMFSGCTSIIDIALDANSNMFGTGFTRLYRIDRHTAKCTLVASGTYPNSLSFVPKGTVDPNEEALVGYVEDRYVRIDPASGLVTTIGNLGVNWMVSSGDIVSVKGGGTYLTTKDGGPVDRIVQVDPTTGALVRDYGSVAHTSVFGLAFWAGRAYGFSDAGELFEITFGTDRVSTTRISIPGAPSGLRFWGAGSTTAAPVEPPK